MVVHVTIPKDLISVDVLGDLLAQTVNWVSIGYLYYRNECLEFPCLNGGTCDNTQGSYICRCPRGFTGTNCELGKYWVLILSK